jgi:DNA topoisomerase-3
MRVFLCEKPSQAKDVAKALGINQRQNGYYTNGKDSVTWAIGHLLSQAPPEFYEPELARSKQSWQVSLLPVEPQKWQMIPPDKTKDKGRYNQLMAIKGVLATATEVVIATDNDREGETIALEIMEYFSYKGATKRMLYSSMDTASLKKAYSNMIEGSKTYPQYIAGLGRMRADWLFGMNMTMALTADNSNMLQQGDVLSAGRVQTPIVYLVVSRELERKNFVPIPFYKFEGDFKTKQSEKYTGFLKIRPEFLDEKTGYLIDENKMKALYEELKNSKEAKIIKYQKSQKSEKCPIGFSLSELQKEGSKRFGFASKHTLDLAQSLYEKHKLTTYPRSDSGYMEESQFGASASIISKLKSNFNNKEVDDCVNQTNPKRKSAMWNQAKVTAHHAIIPTNIQYDLSKLSKDEYNMYELISKRYLMQFMPDYTFLSVQLETKVVNDIFTTSGNTTVDMGWKIADPKTKEQNKSVPVLNNGDTVDVVKVTHKKDETKPPASYTEDKLLDDLVNIRRFIENEKLKKIIKGTGIGTEATRANHLDNLFKRSYLKKDGKKILPTDKAYALIEIIPDILKKPETTAYWEEELNQIVHGKRTLDQFMAKVNDVLNRMIKEVKDGNCKIKKPVSGNSSGKLYTCDKCTSVVKRVKSSKTKKFLWVCNKDECKTWYEDNVGRRGKEIVRVEQPKGDHKCPTCQKQIFRRKNKTNGEFFWVCGDDKCKTFCKDNAGALGEKVVRVVKAKATSEHDCPNCKDGNLIKRKGSKGDFWGCNNYPKCTTTFQDKDGKPDIIVKK